MLKLAKLRPIVPVSDHSHLVLAHGTYVLVWTKIEAVSDFRVNMAAFVNATAAPLVTARSNVDTFLAAFPAARSG